MERGPEGIFGSVIVGLVALALAVGPLWDSYEDVVVQNDLAVLVVLENGLPLALVCVLLYGAVWLASSSLPDEELLRAAGWCLASLLGIGLVVAWALGFQVLQGTVKPRVVLVDAALVSAIAGLGAGVYAARQRQQRRELRLERDRSAALFEHSTDAIAEVASNDGDPIVLDVNEAFEETFGVGSEAARGRSLDELVVPPEREDEARRLNDQALEGERFEEVVERETADGERGRFILRAIPFDPEDPSRGYAVYTDVTERERTRERLAFLNRVLRHDLSNDVTVIAGEAGLLAETVEDPEGRCAEIKARADHVQELIDATRTILRAVEDGGDPDLEPIPLDEQLRSAVDAVGAEYPEATVETAGDLPAVRVRADDLLRQALLNLLRNGIDHNDGDERTVVAAASAEDDRAIVRIADDGPGFPRADADALFGKDAAGDEGGTGVGLYLVDTLVRRYGGDVRVADSELGGAAVVLELPLAEAAGVPTVTGEPGTGEDGTEAEGDADPPDAETGRPGDGR